MPTSLSRTNDLSVTGPGSRPECGGVRLSTAGFATSAASTAEFRGGSAPGDVEPPLEPGSSSQESRAGRGCAPESRRLRKSTRSPSSAWGGAVLLDADNGPPRTRSLKLSTFSTNLHVLRMYCGGMPVMLQVRNLPDDVHAKLKRRAADAGMSLSEYVGRQLAQLVETRSVAEVMAWVDAHPAGMTRAELDAIGDDIRRERDSR